VTPSRRDVLKLGAIGGGVLVVGVQLPGCWIVPGPNAMRRHAAKTGELKPNAWIRITPDDRIIFTLDRVEMGQGTMTSGATLIAEELEVDPARIEVEMAQASRAYDNPDKQLGFQITGGSTSTRTSWVPLRKAGAACRMLLEAGAAATWKVPRGECVARDGVVTHAASGRSARYGELAAAAAEPDAPGKLSLKPADKFRWIGTEQPRLDAAAKSTGTAGFGIDVRVPEMVFAVLARPPVRGSRLRAVRDTAARAVRGVRDVVPLDGAVAVIADATWPAMAGAAALEVDWEPGPLRRVHTPELREQLLARAAEHGKRIKKKGGDARGAVKRADQRLVATYEVPYLAHATMEPMNATAVVRGDTVEVWAPTQAPGAVRAQVSLALGVRQEDITVHTTFLGGGFGRRLQSDFVVEAALISRVVKRPVQVVWTREDDIANDYYRPIYVHRLEGGVANGQIAGWVHHVVGPSVVAHAGPDFVQAIVPYRVPRATRRWLQRTAGSLFTKDLVPDITTTEGADKLPYKIGAWRVELSTVDPGIPCGFWRSVGHSHTAFAVESFVDELAHAAGKDPVDFRRRMLPDGAHKRVLELVAAKAAWGTPAGAGVGRGFALHASFGSTCAHAIDASVDGDRVTIHRVVSAIECGTVVNPAIVRSQIESGVIYGLSAALRQEITFDHGVVGQSNFHDFPLLRMNESPAIEVHIVPSTASPEGVGEPGVPPVAPALCNAIFAATGKRIRRLPIERALREGWT
jgi:isoquinoline 1-oxidoreductase/isoquinoline 1-oxidoreductase beta subunit